MWERDAVGDDVGDGGDVAGREAGAAAAGGGAAGRGSVAAGGAVENNRSCKSERERTNREEDKKTRSGGVERRAARCRAGGPSWGPDNFNETTEHEEIVCTFLAGHY